MAVCDNPRIPRPGSPADDEHDVIKFTDSDCETIMEELDTPRIELEKQKKLIKSSSSTVIGSYKKEKNVIIKSGQILEFSAAIAKNDNHETNSRKSAFSRVKGKNQTALEDAVTVQSNHDHTHQKHSTNVAPTGNTSGVVPKVSSNGKEDGVSRHHGNSESVDPRNEAGDSLNDCGVQENDTVNSITKVTLNISNLESPEGGEHLGRTRTSRSSTNSSSSSLRDQGSQTCRETAGDMLQYPVSPRVSPATVARYSPRRVTSAELHRTPEQMVKQADRLIERTQAILERSAEAKRRTEDLLKASRERRAQERLEELASYKGERLSNSKDANTNNEHRTEASLDTNGNHENNGYEEENSNVIPAH